MSIGISARGALWVCFAALAVPAQEAPTFTALDLRVEGEILEQRFLDVDGDGRRDLLLAVLGEPVNGQRRREIRLHLMGQDGLLAAVPSHMVSVPEDVVAFGAADLREEPGRELFFLTRSGAHSYSTQREGLRDNIRRLASFHTLYQVPSARALPFWGYVISRPAGQRDLILLPGGANLALFGPTVLDGVLAVPAALPPAAPTAGPDYTLLADFGGDDKAALFSVRSPGALRTEGRGLRIAIETGDSGGLFLGDAPAVFAAMLQSSSRYRAPALVDVDGDGRLDLVADRSGELAIHLGTAAGLPTQPTRVEPLPAALTKPDHDLLINLVDFDADGDVDVYARTKPDRDGLQSTVFRYFFFLNDGSRLLREEPDDLRQFEGTGTDSQIIDVNGDGLPDLVVTKYTLPQLSDLVTGFKLERSALVFFAEQPGRFARKPSLRDDQTFTIDSLQDALVTRHMAGDLSGDGLADLIEADLSGHVVIRRTERKSKLFGGEEWRLEKEAWKRFDLGANLESLVVEDVNSDGLVDVINPRPGMLSLLLSRPAPRSRR
ncbi:MAG: FG-GAP repeat domain-containing protein [Planctomycetota bacterium]